MPQFREDSGDVKAGRKGQEGCRKITNLGVGSSNLCGRAIPSAFSQRGLQRKICCSPNAGHDTLHGESTRARRQAGCKWPSLHQRLPVCAEASGLRYSEWLFRSSSAARRRPWCRRLGTPCAGRWHRLFAVITVHVDHAGDETLAARHQKRVHAKIAHGRGPWARSRSLESAPKLPRRHRVPVQT